MEAKWIFPFMLVSIAFILLRAETAVAASNISISYQGCNQNKTCLSTPVKCDPAASGSCFFLSAGWPLNSTNITFELSGQSSGYIAVAFSKNNQMDNDSNIYACANDSGVKLIHTTLRNRSSSTLGNLSSEALVSGSVNGSTIQCVFTVSGLNVPILNSLQLNISNIFLIKGNFSNGTLETPIDSTAGLDAVPSAIPSSTALGTNNTTTLGGNKDSTTTTTNNNNAATTTTTINTKNNNTTTTNTAATNTTTANNDNTAATNTKTAATNNNTATTTTKNNNSGGSGNNALQSTSAKAPLVLIGAIVVALLSG